MQQGINKAIAVQRLEAVTAETVTRSLHIPLQHGSSRRIPPKVGASSADPLDRRRRDRFGRAVAALHYTATGLRTDGHLSRSSPNLRRPARQGKADVTHRGYEKAIDSRLGLTVRPATARSTASAHTQNDRTAFPKIDFE